MKRAVRLYHPGTVGPGTVTIAGEQARRLGTVMRLREGDEFRLFGGDGREWAATVASQGRGAVHVSVGEVVRQETPPRHVLELWCAIVRPARFDIAVEKCTEAGADVIRPLLTGRTVREGNSAGRQERWQRIAVEASEQCGRLRVPVIEPPATFDRVLRMLRGALLIGDRDGIAPARAAAQLPANGTVAVAVGPEGGFTPEEVAAARAAGATAVAFGPHTLRTETAAIAAIVLVRSLLP